MKRINRGIVGIDEGEVMLFSDFASDGIMWTGEGQRTLRHDVTFDEPFLAPPVVRVWITMQDISNSANIRTDVASEAVTPDGFGIVFSTWADTRIARIRVGWLAIGPVPDDDMWDVT